MDTQALQIFDIAHKALIQSAYNNSIVAKVNDSVIRMSVMTEPYFWHFHPNSDESFLAIEGTLYIDLEDRIVELLPNQVFTVPKNVIHRTRPKEGKSVNLTFESADMITEEVKP